jgi:ketosteroid isomerase-like protein
MSELEDFLAATLPRQLKAEEALHNGDVTPRLEMWSQQDPVTVFGAMRNDIGSEDVRRVFRWLATRFSNLTDYRFELVAAGTSGDLAYTLGYEHFSHSMDGVPIQPSTLRVTHVYRRENGEWKIVHRHADQVPIDQTPRAKDSTKKALRRSENEQATKPDSGGDHE